jgi:NAD(P)-dependent dehydrogenase (short-subunit alcohol dehydrogenase family)
VGRIEGNVTIITGAGDGIGAGIARRFGEEGARLVLADVRGEAVGRVADELRATGAEVCDLVVDVAHEADVRSMVRTAISTFGRLDTLINNAWGGGRIGRVEAKTNALLQHGLDVAYFGPLWAMQEAYPHLRDGGGGSIINLCSLNGVNAHVGTLEYNAAKEALRALTRTAAREWAHHQIRANAICPGAKSAAFNKMAAEHPEIATMADEANPMGRLGDPYADIAPVALFLASADARYVTGNTLFVDGGSHINGVAWTPDLGPELA